MENYMGMSLGLEVWHIRTLKSWGGEQSSRKGSPNIYSRRLGMGVQGVLFTHTPPKESRGTVSS